MAKEIERKFLVDGKLFDRIAHRGKGEHIAQAYFKLDDPKNDIVLHLSGRHPSVSLRYGTGEGKSHKFEFDLPRKDAQEMAQVFAPILKAEAGHSASAGARRFMPWKEAPPPAAKGAARYEIRLRIKDNDAFLTFKRKVSHSFERDEFEYRIPRHEAKEMLDAFPTSSLTKTRHEVRAADGQKWEIDCYHGAHEGLIVAEIELKHAKETFARPIWATREITGDRQYGNRHLAESPITPACGIGRG